MKRSFFLTLVPHPARISCPFVLSQFAAAVAIRCRLIASVLRYGSTSIAFFSNAYLRRRPSCLRNA